MGYHSACVLHRAMTGPRLSVRGGEFNHPAPTKVHVCHPADVPLPSLEKQQRYHILLKERNKLVQKEV